MLRPRHRTKRRSQAESRIKRTELRVGIVGAGKGAALHAAAAQMVRGVSLVGVGGDARSGDDFAQETGIANVGLEELLTTADMLVVAVPPCAAPSVIGKIAARPGTVRAVLVETPLLAPLPDFGVPMVAGANLLHAPLIRDALTAIGSMGQPHHLVIRATQPAPTWGQHGTRAFGGPATDPGARYALLLAAAGREIVAGVHIAAARDETTTAATVTLRFPSGRTARVESVWGPGSARLDFEVADANGVVSVVVDPIPSLEINGEATEQGDLHPLAALGFVDQLYRLSLLARQETEPWPEVNAAASLGELIHRADPWTPSID